jgi:hypothetical protein
METRTEHTERVRAEAKAAREAEQRRIDAIQAAASYDWLANHTQDYVPSEKNNMMIAKYLETGGFSWTVENLEMAFQALRDEFDPTPVVEREQPAPPAPVAEANHCPWKQPLDKAQLKAMDPKEMSRIMQDRKWGEMFKSEVKALGIPESRFVSVRN